VHPGDLAGGFSDLEMTWLLYCASAATDNFFLLLLMSMFIHQTLGKLGVRKRVRERQQSPSSTASVRHCAVDRCPMCALLSTKCNGAHNISRCFYCDTVNNSRRRALCSGVVRPSVRRPLTPVLCDAISLHVEEFE